MDQLLFAPPVTKDSDSPSYYYEVLVPPLARPLTYSGEKRLSVGSYVTVRMNGSARTAYVIKVLTENPLKDKKIKIKPLGEAGNLAAFSEEHLEFFSWMSRYYQEKLSKVIQTAVPKLFPPKKVKYVRLIDDKVELKGTLQKEILVRLQAQEGYAPLKSLAPAGKSISTSIKTLAQKQIIEIDEKPESSSEPFRETPEPAELNSEQQVAAKNIIECIEKDEHQAFLLHGITGSGKTEVYINCIIEARNRGKSCLILVPEISLTPQLINRLEARLGEKIAVLHSGLTQKQRSDFWRGCLQGNYKIVLGARSAIFAPCINVGLIIVDEEHDQSFKQSDSMRYHARDLAIVRSKLSNCPVVLGSATPSLESYLNVFRKKLTHLRMNKRYGDARLPSFCCIDLTKMSRKHMASRNISRLLENEIKSTLEANQQVFLLYNRRGYASFVLCVSCGESLYCPHCDVSLTYHESSDKLICHYCFEQASVPKRCPTCSSPNIQRLGAGTERIYEELQELFPEVAIDRLDRDSAKKLSDYENILAKIRSLETQILVGTQMIAKGHDLPEVTLVGVIDCDVGLHMPDFRATEKAYQLLTQVGGRAGRGKNPGKVLLQTRNPEHISIVSAINRDYDKFAVHELQQRKMLNYPPFWRLMRIVASSTTESFPEATLTILKREAQVFCEKHTQKVSILGPSPTPIARIKDRFRWHLIIKAENVKILHALLKHLREGWKSHPSTRVTFDLDAYDML